MSKIKILSYVISIVFLILPIDSTPKFLCATNYDDPTKTIFTATVNDNFIDNKIMDITSIESNYILSSKETENKTENEVLTNDSMWVLNLCHVTEAWKISTGKGVKVGIIDSGIDYSVPDLKKNEVDAGKCFSCNTIGGCNTNLINGHGTMVAGIIGSNNDLYGATGVSPDATIVDLRIKHQTATFANIIKAIEYADKNDIKIVNISFGSGGLTDHTIKKFRAVIKNYDGLIICSAGNNNSNNDIKYHYPSNFGSEFENVITVGGCNGNGEKMFESNYGKETVDVFAPGVDVTVVARCSSDCCQISNHHHQNGYSTSLASGTSIAAPFVSGVAALIWSAYPELSACEVKDTIMKNVDKIDELEDLCISGGLINAYKAITNIQRHQYKNENIGKISGHLRTCSDCGYEGIVDHVFGPVRSSFFNGVLIACQDCGFILEEKYDAEKN